MTRRFPPETPTQAASWERVRANAVRYGLCELCAAQLAWAHQTQTGGFEAVHPPCKRCEFLVALLPVERKNGWRTVRGSAANIDCWPLEPFPGRTGTPSPGGGSALVSEAHDTGRGRSTARADGGV